MNPEKFLPAKIVDRTEVAEDLFLLHVQAGAPFSFLAGQYATLGVEIDGKRLERAYSLCSSPYEDVLEFFVERVPAGQLSPLLYAMEKGAPLLLRRFAKGRFTLDLRSGRKNHLLLATVTGVAPYVSYIRTVYEDWKKGGTPMPGEHRLVLHSRGEPVVGVWLPQRIGEICSRSALAEICSDGQPGMGATGVDWGNRARGRSDPQIHELVGFETSRYDRLSLRTPQHGGEWPSHTAASRLAEDGTAG